MTDDPIDEGVATGDGREDLRARATENGIEFFLAMFVDLHGKPCAKAVPMASFDLLMDGGAGFAGFAAGDLGQCPADPDITAVPDPASYTRVPWKDGVAVLHCDPYVDGEPWPYAPRVILKRLLAELADDRGWTLKTGVEAEYSLLRRTPDGKLEIADALDSAAKPCYEVKGLTRMWDFLSTLSRHMNTLGWGNYANDHEDGNGQFENNFVYSDAVTTADRTIFFRYMVHMLAHEAGMTATFMPKPFGSVTGNGQHIHQSLWTLEGQLLFTDDTDRGLDPGEQVTDDMYAFRVEEVARRGIVHLAKTLDRALDELVADEVLRTALRRVPGGDVIDYYADVRQAEFDAYRATVSGWEIDRCLTLMWGLSDLGCNRS